jgi:site-specific recombinase XerD
MKVRQIIALWMEVMPQIPHRQEDGLFRLLESIASRRSKKQSGTTSATFASRLVMAGVEIRTVQELMGHKTIQVTMRYAHLAPGH